MRHELKTAGEVVDRVEPDQVISRTARASRNHPQKVGGFATISQGLDYAARGETGFNFYSSRGALERVLAYSELRELAFATGQRLIASGLKRGERVGVIAETGADFMAVFFGCQYAGLVPCPVPYTMYIGGKESYIERMTGMLKAARASAIVAGDDLLGHVEAAAKALGNVKVFTHSGLASVDASHVVLEPFTADDVAYVQYSSGSTSSPKGVLISQKAIMANAEGILRQGMAISPADRAFSWLPLYHDMGLVGFCLSPMLAQVTVDYLSTPSFARRPALWLKLMSDNRSTITFSPSFGYDLAGRRLNGDAPSIDLSALRVAGIGGDMVRADVLEAFATHMKPAKFNPTAFLPSYGMAESTLAITFSDLTAPAAVDVVDRAHYKLSRRAVPAAPGLKPERTRTFVVCGRPLEGHEMKVTDDDGRTLGDREIGHILVKGPSLMNGYYEAAEATDAVMRDGGFMDTGDMGYLIDGQIVITGRAKDLILHNGRNIWPQDIEWAAEHIEPLRSGDVAAFGIENDDGEDQVTVLVQCRLTAPAEMEDLRRKVSASVHHSAGVECDVVLVAPKSLPFTSSGKLSRAAAKARFVSGEIAEIAANAPVHAVAMPLRAVAAQ